MYLWQLVTWPVLNTSRDRGTFLTLRHLVILFQWWTTLVNRFFFPLVCTSICLLEMSTTLFSILPCRAGEVKPITADIASSSESSWFLLQSQYSASWASHGIALNTGLIYLIPATDFFPYLSSVTTKVHLIRFLPQFQSTELFLNSESSVSCHF